MDLHFDAERARVLRKRFLWLCAVSAVLMAVTSAASVPRVLETEGKEFVGALISMLGDLISAVAYAAAFVYARKVPPKTKTFLRLAFYLFVVGSIFGVVYTRISLQLDVVGWFEEANVKPAAVWLGVAPSFLLVGHLITSLFMPWSLRESLVPAAIVVAAVAAVIGIDMAFGKATPWAMVSLFFCALSIVPGALICWWRFSRFRQNVEHKYFSSVYRQLKHELSTARRIHESSLPPQRETGNVRLSYAYDPMREIGGDLLFVPLFARENEDRLSAVLLDVTGHGIAAALAVNRIVGELERLYAERPEAGPGEILSSLNHYLCLTMARHSVYATAICLHVDAERDVVEYANGGHPPAFVRRKDGHLERLDPTAMLLGVLDGEAFDVEVKRLAFGEGDTLVGYTDGANEARDGSGSDLGIEGVRALLESAAGTRPAVREWAEAMLDRVREHRSGAAEDDTLVVVVYRPSVIAPTTSGARASEGRR